MRLQKFMAGCGIASRRSCEDIIRAGRVTINGNVVNEMGQKIDPNIDCIKVDGKIITLINNKIILMMNKPVGYLTTMNDPQGRPTIKDLIDCNKYKGIFPIGRLDKDTSGLLLLTNDGDLAYKCMHPSTHFPKKYIAKIDGYISDDSANQLRNGIDIGGYVTQPAKIKILKRNKVFSKIEIVIYEGKKRQIRYMCKATGHEVKELKRIEYGNLELGNLEVSKIRELNLEEIEKIRSYF